MKPLNKYYACNIRWTNNKKNMANVECGSLMSVNNMFSVSDGNKYYLHQQ